MGGDSGSEFEIRAIFAGGGVSLAVAEGEAALAGMIETVGVTFLIWGDPDNVTAATEAGDSDDEFMLVCIFSMCWFKDFFTRNTLAQKWHLE